MKAIKQPTVGHALIQFWPATLGLLTILTLSKGHDPSQELYLFWAFTGTTLAGGAILLGYDLARRRRPAKTPDKDGYFRVRPYTPWGMFGSRLWTPLVAVLTVLAFMATSGNKHVFRPAAIGIAALSVLMLSCTLI